MLATGMEKVGGFKRYNNGRIHKLWWLIVAYVEGEAVVLNLAEL